MKHKISLQKKKKKKPIEYYNMNHRSFIFFKSATANPYVVYGTQTQQNMMATPSSISSPGVYPITSYPPPEGAAYPQTTDNNLSHPPPSYDALMALSTSHVYDTV